MSRMSLLRSFYPFFLLTAILCSAPVLAAAGGRKKASGADLQDQAVKKQILLKPAMMLRKLVRFLCLKRKKSRELSNLLKAYSGSSHPAKIKSLRLLFKKRIPHSLLKSLFMLSYFNKIKVLRLKTIKKNKVGSLYQQQEPITISGLHQNVFSAVFRTKINDT